MIGDLEINPFNPDHVLFGTGATIYGTNNSTDADKGGSTTWSVHAQGLEETAVLDLASPTWGDSRLYSALGDIGTFRHDDLAGTAEGMDANPIFGTACPAAHKQITAVLASTKPSSPYPGRRASACAARR